MIQSVPIISVLSTLWSLINRRQRLVFMALIGSLMVAGVIEMGTILLILGFVKGLSIDPETGQRAGKLMSVLDGLFGPLRLNDVEYALYVGGGLLFVLVVRNGISTISFFFLNRFLMKLNQRISVNLLRGYLVLPYEQFNAEGAEKASNAISKIFSEFSKSFSATAQVLADGLTLTFVVGLLFFVDPGFTLIAAAIFAAAGLFSYSRMQKFHGKMNRRARNENRRADRFLRDGLEGIVETRLRDARRRVVHGYSEALNRLAMFKRRGSAVAKLPRTVNELALIAFLIGAVLRFALAGESVKDALPTLAVFAFAGLKMNGFMSRLNRSLQILRKGHRSFEEHSAKLRELAPAMIRGAQGEQSNHYLASERPLKEGQDGRLHDAVIVENVSYRYPGAKWDALKRVSLRIEKGQFVGLCGASGGGKSTLALLLLGLLDPKEGRILCDGWPLAEHIRRWHENVGYVGQDMYFSRATIRENVAFSTSDEEIDDERVQRALRMARAEQFVSQLPQGTKTMVHRGARNFSMGQRQRLIIARALYLDPDVLVFDEATASVDNITEREIVDAIVRLSGQKTIISIAHRLSTLEKCDMIYLINDGKIEASGTYETLLRESPGFRRLAQAPASG